MPLFFGSLYARNWQNLSGKARCRLAVEEGDGQVSCARVWAFCVQVGLRANLGCV